MKKYIVILAFSFWLVGCASVSPVGLWNYSVTGTPNGDYTGTMTVTKNKAEYKAVLSSQGGDILFNQFTFDKKSMKSAGNFDYQGTPIFFDATVTETEMSGHMAADESQFPFKATRKK